MPAITHNPKYNLYQVTGTKQIYLFDFEYCQQVKKDLPYKNIPPEMADQWYSELGYFRRKKVKVATISTL